MFYNYSLRYCPGATLHGPYGGNGGIHFDERPDNCQSEVRRIVIYHQSLVDSIQITYKMSNGQDFIGQKYGGDRGRRDQIDLNEGEKIISVSGRTEDKVDQLSFTTSFGRTFGPFGGGGGRPFKIEGCNLRGIKGAAKTLVDSIGFYCSQF